MSIVRVISCKVFRHELDYICNITSKTTDSVFLNQDLHQQPDDLKQCIQDSIAEAEKAGFRTIVLLFGYCGGALEGLVSTKARLVVPRAHDCIPLLLGEQVDRTSHDEVDTFYLSGGWLDYASDPYKKYLELVDKYDEETAQWCVREMMKAYSKLVLISSEICPAHHYRDAAHRFAEFFGLSYREKNGSLSWINSLIKLREGKDILVFQAGQKITRDYFP